MPENDEAAIPTLETLPVSEQAEVPETFPMGLEEYAVTTGLHYLWAAGLAAYAGRTERYRTEWDALLAEFETRPVQSS